MASFVQVGGKWINRDLVERIDPVPASSEINVWFVGATSPLSLAVADASDAAEQFALGQTEVA